ncbi:MAG: tetratricopeptide repeat protein [Bacteroidetes bacterium]|nr:MAG: tetratricopeptide repeat protein [Bacteroidota bacterium]TAG94522.1 MAG: tetratricopeptide repeat protein [Bacteroidota bacterium]
MNKKMNKILIILTLIWILVTSCDRYNPVNDDMQKIPDFENLAAEASLKALQDNLGQNSDAAEPNFQMALYRIRKKEDSLAIPFLEKSLQIDSTKSKYFLALSRVYANMGKTEKALDVLNKSKGLGEKSLESLILGGELYYIAKEYNEAIKSLNEALQISKRDARIYFWKANVEIARLDSANALKNLSLALKYKPNYYEVFNSYAQLFSKYESYNAAIYYVNLGLKINANNDALNFTKAEAFRLKKFADDSAFIYYKKVYSVNPKIWQASYFLGKYSFERGQGAEAQKYFLSSLKYKDFSNSRYYLGMSYYYSNQKEKAIKELLKATKLDSQNLAANEWYWKVRSEIEAEKQYRYQDSLQKQYYKSLQLQQQIIPVPK